MNIGRVAYTLRTYRWLINLWRLPFVPELPIDRPIFLLGLQGGGLSLLSRMLRRHPAAVSVAGNSQYWTSSDEMANTFGLILPAEFAGMRFKAPYHPVLTAPRSWTYASLELLNAYRKRAGDVNAELESELKRAIRFSILLNALDPYDSRFIDKSQTNCVRLGLINSALRDCHPKFVLLTRDPYASVFRAANGKAGDMKRLASVLPYEERVRICTEHYFESMRATYEDSDEENIEVLQVRFEDLLREPRTVLRQVCEGVELDFQETMLPSASDVFPRGTRFKGRWWPIRPDVNTSYQSSLDQVTKDYVNGYDQDLVSRLGYEVIK